jgi:hypothetical protein
VVWPCGRDEGGDEVPFPLQDNATFHSAAAATSPASCVLVSSTSDYMDIYVSRAIMQDILVWFHWLSKSTLEVVCLVARFVLHKSRIGGEYQINRHRSFAPSIVTSARDLPLIPSRSSAMRVPITSSRRSESVEAKWTTACSSCRRTLASTGP